ncbi:flagellar hook-associated protein FlgK [Arthrobacter bambusae]|uniref:flagellar hook-associated protein FlgK n=1 Tax=Arthrobacter bambusae TaxID=1338426 RepID=UPI00278BA735|nr:flagellar hook-associated protein FlgK [Arthrobacter bambusae]MDQ0029420.1 flagellar hook-associated protein 1 FlgK [Arthrobacter bambusae]MDQ0097080.1 flagellar hook-associated protein 1 FlgK [Arthrobacter bambusae]
MSTFGGLNTAYLGLTAAQQAINVAGQNIVNAGTDGYTRQRIEQSALSAPARTGLLAAGVQAGQGVSVDGIARLGNSFLDAGVRASAAQAGYAGYRSSELQSIEGTLQEPGPAGISTALQSFWSAWQGVSNSPGEAAPAGLLLQAGRTLANTVSAGYKALDSQWTRVRGEAQSTVATLNAAAAQVANFNATIRSMTASGASANELIDARNKVTETISSLAGGTVRDNADGTVDVFVGGNAIVSGTSHRDLALAGQTTMSAPGSTVPAGGPAQVEWADRPGVAVPLDGGKLAGAVSLLAPAAAGGTGGAIAEAAASYNAFATKLMNDVNAVHRTGQSTTGATNLDFFATTPGTPAALSLSVVPTNAAGIGTGTPGSGALDGSIADSLAQIGVGPGSPDSAWSGIVTGIGTASRAAQQHEQLANAASTAAVGQRSSGASVSLDEENINLLTSQHAYQAAARAMTAVDETLDVLINHTGLVGR